MVGCEASAGSQGLLHIAVAEMDVDLARLDWQYRQQRWPHEADQGVASANTSLSFNVSVDMVKGVHELFNLKLSKVDLDMGSVHHAWLIKEIEKFTKFMLPLVSKVVQREAGKALDTMLSIVHEKGACALIEGSLSELDLVKLQFTSYEPFETKVPMLGHVSLSVNSTEISPPTSMSCRQVNFSGTALTVHVQQVPFSAGFLWAYRKLSAKNAKSWWHNKGAAQAKVVAGAFLHIDLLKPSDTKIEVEVPTLELQLQADADGWLYKELGKIMAPMLRKALQKLGGRVLTRYVEKCLADPSCPRTVARPSVAPAAEPSTAVFI